MLRPLALTLYNRSFLSKVWPGLQWWAIPIHNHFQGNNLLKASVNKYVRSEKYDNLENLLRLDKFWLWLWNKVTEFYTHSVVQYLNSVHAKIEFEKLKHNWNALCVFPAVVCQLAACWRGWRRRMDSSCRRQRSSCWGSSRTSAVCSGRLGWVTRLQDEGRNWLGSSTMDTT